MIVAVAGCAKSGILNENVSGYFNGSTIISRDTWNSYAEGADDNMILGYYDGDIDDSRSEDIFCKSTGLLRIIVPLRES
jgi:hypothetical protein